LTDMHCFRWCAGICWCANADCPVSASVEHSHSQFVPAEAGLCKFVCWQCTKRKQDHVEQEVQRTAAVSDLLLVIAKQHWGCN